MDGLIPLSNASLCELPATVKRPHYDRRGLKPGIVHIGLGNFHRAHQAWYLHRLFEDGLCHDWAIIGASVRASDRIHRQKLLAQDCLTTLIELEPSGMSAEVIGSIIDFLPIEQDNAALIRQMADPAIRVVTLTVTEGGYFVDLANGGGFNAGHPEIVHDAQNPERPRTAHGAMVAALRMRRERGVGPFTVQSCDNLRGNGGIVRQTLVSLARLSDPDLADWIDCNCSFPNSMVDCIVPATGSKEIAFAAQMGIDDKIPVTHEAYRQWVIEDDFCAGRPCWHRAGAMFSESIHEYETMKIRILNAGHQIIANPGEILSIGSIADCMAHPLLHDFFRKVQMQEIVPYVNPVSLISPCDYVDLIDRRFSNAAIVDTPRRVAFDGSSRHTGFVLPILRDALKVRGPVEGLALVEALWARMCEGTREDGTTIAPNDPIWEQLQTTARAARRNPRAWLEQRRLYGDLADSPSFAKAFERWLSQIWANGSEKAMQAYVEG